MGSRRCLAPHQATGTTTPSVVAPFRARDQILSTTHRCTKVRAFCSPDVSRLSWCSWYCLSTPGDPKRASLCVRKRQRLPNLHVLSTWSPAQTCTNCESAALGPLPPRARGYLVPDRTWCDCWSRHRDAHAHPNSWGWPSCFVLAEDGSTQFCGSDKELARRELTQDHVNCDEIVDTRHPQNGSNAPFKRNCKGGKPAERIHSRTATENHRFHICKRYAHALVSYRATVFKGRYAGKTGNWRNASNTSSVPSLASNQSGMHKLLP